MIRLYNVLRKFLYLSKSKEPQLVTPETKIVEELLSVQGKPVEMGGYYNVDRDKVREAMRPSATLNGLLDSF